MIRCTEDAFRPDKLYSGSFIIRITPQLHKLSQYEDTRCGVGLNDFVRRAIENELSSDRVEIHEQGRSQEYLHLLLVLPRR